MNNKYRKLILLVCVFLVLVGTLLFVYGQSDIGEQQQERLKHIPVVKFDKPLPSDPQKRKKLEVRKRARNLKGLGTSEVRKFMLSEKRGSIFGVAPSHGLKKPAIPATQSDAIILGVVKGSEAHLSEDRTALFSEFFVEVTQVLKQSPSRTITNDGSVSVARNGGAVRFPSGKVIYHARLDRGMPEIGKKYLFFLDFTEEAGFSIITAYKIANNAVTPLDGKLPNGKIVKHYREHHEFDQISESDFIDKVRTEIEKALR